MDTRIRNFLIIIAGMLFLFINGQYFGISFWFSDVNEHPSHMFALILSGILLFYSGYLFRSSKSLALLGILISLPVGLIFLINLTFAPEVSKIDSLEFSGDIKVDVYKLQNQNYYVFIQRNRFFILSRDDCIYSYEHFTGATWKKIDESTISVKENEIKISKDWFTDISCPED